MTSIESRRVRTAVAAALTLLAGLSRCAPRFVSPGALATGAASSQAVEAPRAHPERAVIADPPLPGEPTVEWPGLSDKPREHTLAHSGSADVE